jgi:hypothetical protein
MKKIFAIMLVTSAFFTVSASAQKNMEMTKQELMDSLKISSTSADSVIAIGKQTAIQVKNIMHDQSLSEDQKKEQIKPIKQATKARLDKFLTQEQMKKLEQMEKEKRESMKNK